MDAKVTDCMEGVKYLFIKLKDAEEVLAGWEAASYNFNCFVSEELGKRGKGVMVTCNSGKNRSVGMLLLYAMEVRGICLRDAMCILATARYSRIEKILCRDNASYGEWAMAQE